MELNTLEDVKTFAPRRTRSIAASWLPVKQLYKNGVRPAWEQITRQHSKKQGIHHPSHQRYVDDPLERSRVGRGHQDRPPNALRSCAVEIRLDSSNAEAENTINNKITCRDTGCHVLYSFCARHATLNTEKWWKLAFYLLMWRNIVGTEFWNWEFRLNFSPTGD